jgi:Lrp/AsnC family leucine-responsive transcriptional regulator
MRSGGKMDETNKKLLALLREDARMSAAALGQKLGLSRTAVRERMKRLERDKIILGYTVIASAPEDANVVTAILSIQISQRPCAPVLAKLRCVEGLVACYSTAGEVDAVMIVETVNTQSFTALIDQISAIPGIGSVEAMISLSREFPPSG